MLFPSKIHFPLYYFLYCPFGNRVVFPDGVLFLLLSVRELGYFSEQGIVSVVVRSGFGLFSRTEGATLALQVPGGGLLQLGIFLCRESPPVGSKCMQVGEDSFPEKDISVQVFLFLDFLFLKREMEGKFIPLSLSL